MEVPSGSTIQVMVAQFLGMLLTAMVMAADGDLVIGCTQLIKGYDPKIREASPNATWIRWLFTGILQSLVGCLLLFDSFVLSMQSTTVIDLALNLTALHFIQEIDEIAFGLAADSGLLGEKVSQDCEHVRNCTFSSHLHFSAMLALIQCMLIIPFAFPQPTVKKYSTPETRREILVLRRVLIAMMTVALIVPYAIVVANQSDGRFICQTLYIQLGDSYIPEMAHYTGFFRSQGNGLRARIGYGQRNYYIDDSQTWKLSFCDSENYWTISKLNEDACSDFVYRSEETDTFDIIEAASGDWFINTQATGVIDADWLKIVCNDCDEEETCNPDNGKCSEKGDKCECKEGRFGLNCQFFEECNYFGLDQRTRDGLPTIPGTVSFQERDYVSISGWGSNFTGPYFYDRPIYAPTNGSAPADNVDSFIIFTGRRWIIYAIPDENLATVVAENRIPSNWSTYEGDDGFIKYFEDRSHLVGVEAMKNLTAELINYFPIFASSPLDYGENSFGFEPSAVSWVLASEHDDESGKEIISRVPDENNPVSARFLCSVCEVRIEYDTAPICWMTKIVI